MIYEHDFEVQVESYEGLNIEFTLTAVCWITPEEQQTFDNPYVPPEVEIMLFTPVNGNDNIALHISNSYDEMLSNPDYDFTTLQEEILNEALRG